MVGIFETYEDEPGQMWLESYTPDSGCPQSGPLYRTTLTGHVAGYLMYGYTPSHWVPIDPSIAYNRGLVNYLKHVRSVQVAFSAPTFLGELAETIHMIRHPAQGLRNLLDDYVGAVKRRKRARPNKWKKDLSSMWLEYSFGWVPLLHDIKDAAEAYHRATEKVREQVPVTAYGIHETRQDNWCYAGPALSLSGHAACPPLYYVAEAKNKAVVRFRGMVKRQVDATPWGNKELFGFTPSEFLPTAWELLPWSFLVDYFSNIGDIVTASVADRSSVAWTNVSTVVFQSTEIDSSVMPVKDARFYGWGCATATGGKPSTAKMVRRTVQRSTPNDIGFPKLEFELPGRPAQWANMTALFAQVSSGIHPQRRR
jgi:hypothetical protein